jgi:hypothetical protein
VSVVSTPNTIVQPIAMMIEIVNTSITLATVLRFFKYMGFTYLTEIIEVICIILSSIQSMNL